jgi:hypothetical protein
MLLLDVCDNPWIQTQILEFVALEDRRADTHRITLCNMQENRGRGKSGYRPKEHKC